MPEYLTISKQQPAFPAYLDFQVLRQIGIDHVQALSSQIWTDYNLHDPGVTILEVLCYAVTDLGYRNNLDITDLLTLNSADPSRNETNFFTPDQILTCNPVTMLDWRKRLIDIPGVRNAWFEKVKTYEPAIYVDRIQGQLQYTPPSGQSVDTALRLNPKGLYRVSLDLEPTRRKDACGQPYFTWADTLDQVKGVLCDYRNLCEDVQDVVILGEEEIALCTDIELELGADPEDVQVEIYVRMQELLAPRLRFYSLQELLSQGKTLADILAGRPSALHDARTLYASHGFIDVDDLAMLEPPKMLHTSDLYQIIMDVPGVRAIKKLSIANYINNLRQSEGDSWCLYLTENHRPVLGLAQSRVTFFKGDLPFKADTDEVERRYYEQQSAYIKAPRDASELDLPVPRGSYFDLADHYSIHHDFPLTYGVGEDGLPDTATPLRKAQAKQLKGYLIFFDQILANYLSQLAHVRELFSWDRERDRQNPDDSGRSHQRTYFAQALTNVPNASEIIRNYHACVGSDAPTEALDESSEFVDYQSWLDAIWEDPTTYRDRRNRFLDHLLARFAETFSDYVLLNFRLSGNRRDEVEVMDDKARFLSDYPTLSRDRFRAFNYCDCNTDANPIWDTDNVSGFQKRVSRLLGTDIDAGTGEGQFWRRSLCHYEVLPKAPTSSPETMFEIILRGMDDAPPLSSKQTYLTLAVAQANVKHFLEAALQPAYYKRLSYRYFYRYVWEVADRQGNRLAVYDHTFSTERERDAALDALLQDVNTILETSVDTNASQPDDLTSLIQIEKKEQNHQSLFIFRLNLKKESQTIVFNSVDNYTTEANARSVAEEALEQLKEKNSYRKNRVRLTYYGFGLIDADGTLLAESSDRYSTRAERDTALQRWLSHLQANQNSVRVEPSTECFFFEIQNAAGDRTLLRGLKGVPTHQQADDQVTRVLSEGKSRTVYQLINETDFSVALYLDDHPFAEHPGRYATDIERDLRLDALLYYLNHPTPVSRIEGETGTYRATLLDREGNPLLITVHTYSTQSQAEAAYRRLLHLASDPVYFQPTRDRTNELPYSFDLVDRRGSTFATHPQRYRSSCQRDLAIRSIVNYVNEDIDRRLVNQDSGIYYQLIDQADSPLLVSAAAYPDETAANEAFDHMLTLARDRANYQMIDQAEGHCPYSFALYEGTTLLASHPDHYDTTAERDQALQALINLVISDDPLYRIDGAEGQFTYALVDLLAATENPPDLLTSAVRYPDADVAQLAFTHMLVDAALGDRYRRLDNLSAPRPYSFELLNDAGELLARPLDADGNPVGYATEVERDAAIEKIICYVAQAEVRFSIVNPEGAFFAEVWEEGGDRLWIGRKTFPDQATAMTEADRIRTLASQADRYFANSTGIGTCPYAFSLTDETGDVIADHPGFYETEAERDRQIQRLWRQFSGPSAFVQTPRTADSRFTFEIPAELFCLFQSCTAEQQQAFQTGAILSSPQEETFATAAEATQRLVQQRLPLMLDDKNIVRTYSNEACEFSFKLIHPVTRGELAVSRHIYRSRADMEGAIAFIQHIARGWITTTEAPGTCCGYYFLVALPGEDAPLKSLTRYPTEERAWQAAGAFAEHLRYRRRYVSPAVDATGRSHGLGITDANRNILAVSTAQPDLDNLFQQLDSVEPFLHLEPTSVEPESEPSGYRFRLVDRLGNGLLVGTQAQPDEETARTHFYRDVLSILWEPGAIERTSTNAGPPYSFRVMNLPTHPDAPREILAIHPPTYASEAKREQAIAHLNLLLRTAQLTAEVQQRLPAYTGRLDDQTGNPLLLSTQRRGYELAYLVAPVEDGFSPAWYREGEPWQTVRDTLVALASGTPPQLTVRVVLSEAGTDRRAAYQVQLIAGERIWFVSRDVFRSIDDAEQQGAHAIQLLATQADRALYMLHRHQYETEWTLILLDPNAQENARAAAWQDGNTLMELAGNDRPNAEAAMLANSTDAIDHFRLIDDENGNCFYSWELTHNGQDQGLGIPPHPFASSKKRDDAIALLQSRVNDEGFHVVEHILLRPQHPPPEPVCSFVPDDQRLDDVIPQNALSVRANLTVQNGTEEFSFTVADEQGDILLRSPSFPTRSERDQAMEYLILSGLPEAVIEQPIAVQYDTQSDRQGHAFIIKTEDDQIISQSRSFAALPDLEAQKQWLQTNLHKFAPPFGLGGDRLSQWQAQQEPRDNYDLTQTSKTGQPGFERFWNQTRDRYYFHVNDCRGNALFYSEAYSGKASRDKGVRSVIRNSIVEEYYTLKQVHGRDRTVYFFTLRATNGQEIGRSRYFDELWKLEACLDWFKHHVHAFAKEFNVELTVPERLIERAIADEFLPIAKALPSETDACPAAYDPYSFWISVVLPYWPARFRDMNFRRLVERTLRLEAPAHVALKICWVDVLQMHEFEEAYRQWLEQLNLDVCQDAACDLTETLNHLLASLTHLKNVYPEGTLHDCDESGPDDNPIILNQTALGTANE
ncbi:MAG TPA: hypothetical protein V6C78_04935 [Crinalium sp.]